MSDERLNRVALEAVASSRTGYADFGDVPYIDAVEVLIDALEHDARVAGARRLAASEMIIDLLTKRLHYVADRRAHPEIAAERIERPVFIVGLPRTGSTHLHGLLSEVAAVRTPKFWEMSSPSPPPEASTANTDPRIEALQGVLAQLPIEMHIRHPMDALRPEQCNVLNDWSGLSQAFLANYDIPTYRNYIYSADYTPAYEAHRRALQHLQWRHPGRWVLKYPKHLMTLDALVAAYPDAHFVWTHRDPAVVVPSVVSLTGYMRSLNTPEYEPTRYGPEWATLEEFCLRRGLDSRDRLVKADSVIDVHYHDLMRDPVGTIEAICAHADIPCTKDDLAAIERFEVEHPRAAHGEHRYTAAEYGLDPAGLRRRFGFYIERFDVAIEAGRA